MEVQTYEVEGVSAHPECSEEELALAEKLGLSGQAGFFERSAGGAVTVCPYRHMTDEEMFAYRELCPQRTEAREYSSGPMPLRVMQVLAHSTEIGFFRKFEVWHPRDPRDPDPVLVGMGQKTWPEEIFLLARWGEHLDDLPALMEKASARWRDRMMAGVRKVASEATAVLARLESLPPSEAFHSRSQYFPQDSTPDWTSPLS